MCFPFFLSQYNALSSQIASCYFGFEGVFAVGSSAGIVITNTFLASNSSSFIELL